MCPNPERLIRADRLKKALAILSDLHNSDDRARSLLSFVQQLHDRDKLPQLIAAHVSGAINDSEIPLPLLYAYIEAKAPMSTPGLKDFFRVARTAFGGPIHEANDPLPTVPITLYRGCVASGKLGISWSSKHAVAQGFAHRCGGGVFKFTLTTMDAVFGSISKIGEYEVFIDPDQLDDVEEVT